MKNTIAMFQLALAITFSLCLKSIQGVPKVHFEDGPVEGTTMTTRNGRSIEAFLGIPYAKPPVGPLRFRNPEPVDKWDHVLTVDTDSNQCPQLDDDNSVVGDEDCLYLNVYSPNLAPTGYLYPTMIYFHGGDFVRGSGRSIDSGPEYLLDRDIVLVTVNYRLGVFGFISTGDGAASGNFGLKDQNLVLKWVKNNIMFFGGDPNSVTIFGQDAGAVCTSLHALTPLSNSLFERFIAQSGSPLAYWAFEPFEEPNESYRKYATKLGMSLNCTMQNTYLLIDCLRTKDINSLVDSNYIFDDKKLKSGTWLPVKENKDNVGAFFTKYPTNIYFFVEPKKIPAIIGSVSDEGLILTAEFLKNNTLYDSIAKDPFAFVVDVIEARGYTLNARDEAKIIYEFFFNSTDFYSPVTDKEDFIQKMKAFITSVAFTESMGFQLITTEDPDSIVPLYYYQFNYRGTFSHTSLTTGTNENIGVTHGDDLIYIFPLSPKIKNVTGDVKFSETDEKMIDTMIDLWTSFASTGVPVTNSTSDSFMWENFDGLRFNHAQIGNDSDLTLSMEQNGFDEKSFNFWYNLEWAKFF